MTNGSKRKALEMNGIGGSGQAPNNHWLGGYVAFPAEEAQNLPASSSSQTPTSSAPTLRRTPSGRGLRGYNVAALEERLRNIAISEPLPKSAIDYDKEKLPPPAGNRYKTTYGSQFLARHGADIIATYGNNSFGIHNNLRTKDVANLVNAQAADVGISSRTTEASIRNILSGRRD